MRSGTTFEATLECGLRLDAAGLEPLAGESGDGGRVFSTVYHDTADRRLARADLQLARRTENGRSFWLLSLPRADARLVLRVPGGPIAPAPVCELLVAPLHGTRLQPVLELRTRRTASWVEELDGAAAELAVDVVDVLENGWRESSSREVRITLLDGDARALAKLERRLRKRGACDAPDVPAVDAASDGISAATLIRLMLRRHAGALVAHDVGFRLGDDIEDVHRLRVAARRLRATLRTARPLLDREWSEPLRDDLRWLGGSFGELRDLDVMLAQVEDAAADFPAADRAGIEAVLAELRRRRARACEAAVEVARSDRYLAVVDAVLRGAEEPPVTESDAVLEAEAAAAFRKLRGRAARLDHGASDEELHRLRIDGKRARYAAELVEPAAPKRLSRFLEVAKRFQDVIGTHQDAVIAEVRLRELGSTLGGSNQAFVLGRLVELQHERRRHARAELPAAWRALEREGRRAFKN